MKLYITEANEEYPEILNNYDITNDMEESTDVLILPGGLGAIKDMFNAMTEHRDILVYNKDKYYNAILEPIFKSNYADEAALAHINMESDYKKLLDKLEERKNERINNGENSKLL